MTCTFLLVGMSAYSQSGKGKYFVNLNSDGVILDGYDAVSFFTDNKPAKGDSKFNFTYHDAIYWFTSADHLRLFMENPAKYDVQFGGYCAYAVSLGRIAPIDVNTFSIVDNRLVIQHNARAVAGWNKDVNGNLIKADKYWEAVAKNKGKQIKTDEEKMFLVNTDKEGVILQGYDAVAYFIDGKAVNGKKENSFVWKGETWYFSFAKNLEVFKLNPDKYAPQFGGFCAYGVADGHKAKTDPHAWSVVDGKLYLNYNKDVQQLWKKDQKNFIIKANENWPEVKKEKF